MDQQNAEDTPKFKKLESQRFNLASCLCPQKVSRAKRREVMEKKAAKARQKKRDSVTGLGIPSASPAKSSTQSPSNKLDIKVTSGEGSLAQVDQPSKASNSSKAGISSVSASTEPKSNPALVSSKNKMDKPAKTVDKGSDPAAVQPLANLQGEMNKEKIVEKQEVVKDSPAVSEPRKLAKELLGSDFEAVDRKQQELIKGKEKSGSNSNSSADINKLTMTVEEELEYMAQLAKIRLRGVNNEIIRAGTLWQESPVLLLLLRRPGCGKLYTLHPFCIQRRVIKVLMYLWLAI